MYNPTYYDYLSLYKKQTFKGATPFTILIEWLLLYHPEYKQAREHAGLVFPFSLAFLGSVQRNILWAIPIVLRLSG